MTRSLRFAAILIFLIAFASESHAGTISIVGTDSIPIREYFSAHVNVSDCAAPCRVEVVDGSLPYGLYLQLNGSQLDGYPTAVEQTSATLRATGSDGKTVEAEIAFAVTDKAFRLLYADLPVAKVGAETTAKLEGQGGKAPYGGCKIERARTFFEGAATPGARIKAEDKAPAWLSLGADCTLTAKPDGEAIVFLVVSASDAIGATAKEFYALRAANDPAAPGWLETKARQYNKDYQKEFSPNGLTLEIDSDGGYGGYGDSAMWTGTYLAGAAYYYAVTKEAQAREWLDKSLAGTSRLRTITGMPGLIARGYENEEWKGRVAGPRFPVDQANHYYEVQEGPLKGWRYLTTASRDQYTGVMWGSATVFEVVDDLEFRLRAAENMSTMAAHIWDHKMRIVDPDGIMTNHGLMTGYGISDSDGKKHYDPYNSPVRFENGMNALMVLNWFNMAAASAPTEEERAAWRERRANLISTRKNPAKGCEFEKDYVSLLPKSYVYADYPEGLVDYFKDVRWFNANLNYNNYYHLIRFEGDPELRGKFRAVLTDYFWNDREPMASGCEKPTLRRAGREKNPHFTWQYLAAMGDRDADKIFDALGELMAFPASPRMKFEVVEPIDIEAVPGHEEQACEPIPVQYRDPSDFQWQRSPYHIKRTWPSAEGEAKSPGVDVVTPYWMGRFFGFVPANI